MPHILPAFETERLLLRPRRSEDLDAVMLLNRDPEVMRFIAAPGAATMSRESVAARSFSHVAAGLGYWSVFARDDLVEMLGYVGLIPEQTERGAAQISYRFGVRHWRNGYASEAVSPLLRHGFGELGLPEISLFTHPDNGASCRLAARLGFTRAEAPASDRIGDPPVPGALFRLTRNEWLSVTPPAA